MQVPVLALAKAIVLVGIAFAIAALLVVAPTVTRVSGGGLPGSPSPPREGEPGKDADGLRALPDLQTGSRRR